MQCAQYLHQATVHVCLTTVFQQYRSMELVPLGMLSAEIIGITIQTSLYIVV